MEYKATIGLEIHVEMKTKSKMFSSTPVSFGAEPNTLTTPYDLAFPGVLPIPNKQAIINAIRVCHALHMNIDNELHFDRKNYFYSDLPKGYQITQDKRPIGSNGYLDIEVNGKTERVEIERLHLEEDTAKQLHFPKFTLVDYNRAGIPLIEIVTKPCIHSSEVAAKYVETIREIVSFLEVSDGKMEEGQLRCDVNVSVSNSNKFGTKVEVKNINSFNYIRIALEYEIARQIKELTAGKKIVQETRKYDEENKATSSMRLKTDSVDYKYFPEANIIPIKLSKKFIEDAINTSNELASDKRVRYMNEYKLNKYDSDILLSNLAFSKYFDECAKLSKHYKSIANWLIVDINAILNKNAIDITKFNVSPKELVELVDNIEGGAISNKIGREIFDYMVKNSATYKVAKEKLNITNQESDDETIRKVVLEVINANEQSVIDYNNGKGRALGYLIGQVMKKTGGKVNPSITSKLMIEELKRRK